jgi:hypothetical protein
MSWGYDHDSGHMTHGDEPYRRPERLRPARDVYECMNCGVLRDHGASWVSCEDELGRSCYKATP